MKITNLRTGRIIRVACVILLTIPIIYLILNYSDSHKKINDVYHKKFAALRHTKVPMLIDGK
jgi:hypothetical protein